MAKNNACLLYGAGDARYEEISVPSLDQNPHDVLIKIAYTGVCGTDVHFWEHGGVEEKVRPGHPVVLGHEASGVITAVGSAVTSLQVGNEVAIEPGFPCRRCHFCRAGKYNLCRDMTFAAVPGPGPVVHGTLATYFRVPEDFCYRLPDGVGLEEGVVFEPLAVATHGVRLADVKPGDDVVVFGVGPVGVLSCAVAKEFGAANIVVVDINMERLEFAAETFGAIPYKFDTSLSVEENTEKFSAEQHLPEGAGVIVEATGATSSVHMGMELIKMGGSYVQVGYGKKMIDFPLVAMSQKEITMRGCFRYGPGDFKLAQSMVLRKKIDLTKLVTKVVPFERAPEAWETARKGQGIKTLIQGPV